MPTFQVHYLRSGHATYPPGATFGSRTMTDYEFVWIQQGDVTYYANGHTYAAPPGSIILSRPGFNERYDWATASLTRHGFFHFNFSHPLPAWGKPATWPIIKIMEGADILRPLFEFIVANAYEDKPTVGPTLRAAVETLLSAFLLGPADQASRLAEALPEPIQRVITFIGNTLTAAPAAPLSLQNLAKAANVNPRHLCRLFSESLGISPMHAVMACRMTHAATLLARTDYKLDVIAAQCGFSNAYHFSRRFKQHFGKPPSVLREDLVAGRRFVSAPFHLVPSLAKRFKILSRGDGN